MIVIITKTIDHLDSAEKLAAMTDSQIVRLCLEYSTEMLNDASWEIIRGGEKRRRSRSTFNTDFLAGRKRRKASR